ncbi:MAG TPA: fibronectin type III domain-containing protein [Planctomycetaceae bacterium]|jgi:hypothetical protein|nr:fibronectin type III domain-containing protein [Planctomycetaceae bacterium]
MASISVYGGTGGVQNFNTGTVTFATPASAQGSPDGTFAASGLQGASVVSDSLDLWNYNVGIPSGQAVSGIQMDATMKRAGIATRLVSVTGGRLEINSLIKSPTGTSADNTPLTTTSAVYTWGGPIDPWGYNGTDLSQSNVNSNTKGTGPTAGVWGTGTTGSSSGSTNVDAILLTFTYAPSASPPGTPTNLVASNASPTSVTLTWTQGSGSPTDNKYQVSTDGTTFGTPVDIGSAVTTVTVSGLTYGQLYFFEVCATNGSGDSAFTAPVPWVCGANLSSQVGLSANDAAEDSTGNVVITGTTGSLSLSVPTDYLGFRFPAAGLAANALAYKAVLWLYFTSTASGSASIDCELSTASAAFVASANNISGRTQTGNPVTWTVASLGAGWNASPSFDVALRAVDAQGGWDGTKAITVIVTGHTSTGLTVEMLDGSTVQAAVLAIFTGNPPVDAFTGVAGGSAGVSGLVSQQGLKIQTSVMGSHVW